MRMDDELQNETHIDWTQVGKTARRLTAASRRRVYSADEVSMQERWHSAIFSQVKFDALDDPEQRVANHWHYIERRFQPPTEPDLTAAFSYELYRAEEINKRVEACNAKGRACRAYQAADIDRTYYLAGRRLSTMNVICADRVLEAIQGHLRRGGKIDWTARTAILDMLEGMSDRAAAAKHGLHHKTLQERYATETAAIEARFGRYCTDWQPRQNGLAVV